MQICDVFQNRGGETAESGLVPEVREGFRGGSDS